MERNASRAIDAVLGVAFAVATVPLSLLVIAAVDGRWLAVLVPAIGMAAAVVLLRRRPAVALAVAWATAIAQMALGLPPLPVDLAVFAVLFAAGGSADRRLRGAGLASALVGPLVATVYLVLPAWLSEPSTSILVSALVLFAGVVSFLLSWTLGLLVALVRRTRQERQAALIEQERGRIAREMHDVVAHSLAVVIAQADGARYAAAADPDRAIASLETVAAVAREALGDVRVMLAGLRDGQPDGPQPTIADLGGLLAQVRTAGLAVEFEAAAVADGLPPGLQLAVHRIVQESLTNALRHGSRATPSRVRLRGSVDGLEIVVESPIEPSRPPTGLPGHGITGMRERARLAGGTLDAAAVGDAFVVRARLPLPHQHGARA